MAYLIDSDWVIDHLLEMPQAVQRLDALAEQGIAISIITYLEVYQGVLRSPDPAEAQEKLATFLEGVVILPLSLPVARRCAQLRHQLKQQGKRVNARAFDLLIAATALEHDLILVTRNTADYADIPHLKLDQA
jgi:predicted nucleic acid-binding protein